MRLVYFFLGLAQLLLAALLFGRGLRERRGFRWALVVVLAISGLGWAWFGTRDLIGAETGGQGASVPVLSVERQLAEQGLLLGRVQGGELSVLAPAGRAGGLARLTQISMVEAVAPDSREIDLHPYEGMALVVRGHNSGGWIYEAEIVEEGGPLLTALVRAVFRTEP